MKWNHFNFKEFKGRMLLTNDFGKYIFLTHEEFEDLLKRQTDPSSRIYENLMEARMIYEADDLAFSESNKYLMQCAKNYLASATSLHIFVVATTCNLNCLYCQANNGSSTPDGLMTFETAEQAVDIALQSPSIHLNFEFQGGEPLMNFPVIRHIVEYAEKNKGNHNVEYNIVTNLTLITDEILEFFKEYSFGISTSLDGNEWLHNRNRPFKSGNGSYSGVLNGIERVRNSGCRIGALQTTTKYSLNCAKEIVSTYMELGFDCIFIRPLTQLGKANKMWNDLGYTAEEFLVFYKNVLNEILTLNKKGIVVQEQHAAILLKRINGEPINYMELRSPCGGGIGQMAYFYDGRVFTCDEGRMLSEMGNDAFLLGDVHQDTYQSIINSKVCRAICASSVLESIPSCCDCVYQPYCGTCPVVNYAMNDDIIEKYPGSFRCNIYKGMLDILFELLIDSDLETVSILKKWSN